MAQNDTSAETPRRLPAFVTVAAVIAVVAIGAGALTFIGLQDPPRPSARVTPEAESDADTSDQSQPAESAPAVTRVSTENDGADPASDSDKSPLERFAELPTPAELKNRPIQRDMSLPEPSTLDDIPAARPVFSEADVQAQRERMKQKLETDFGIDHAEQERLFNQ